MAEQRIQGEIPANVVSVELLLVSEGFEVRLDLELAEGCALVGKEMLWDRHYDLSESQCWVTAQK